MTSCYHVSRRWPRSSCARRRTENRENGGLFLVRNQVPIAFPHLLGLVSHPGVNEPLIDATGRTVGREGVAKGVPASKLRPLAAVQRAVKMVMHFVTGGNRWINSLRLAPGKEELSAEDLHAARMTCEPLPQDCRRSE